MASQAFAGVLQLCCGRSVGTGAEEVETSAFGAVCGMACFAEAAFFACAGERWVLVCVSVVVEV